MRILVCSPSFPTSKTIDFVFVDQLCRAFADLGNEVVVLAPQSVTKCVVRHIPLVKRHSWFQTAKGARIELYRPFTYTLSKSRLSNLFYKINQRAIEKAFKRMKVRPDVCYGHFWGSIFALYPIASQHSLPLFGASGEENVSLYVKKSEEEKQKIQDYLSGVVSVSSKNQKECLELNLISKEKSIVIPNAVDLTLFHPLNREESKRSFNLKNGDFVVAFVGQFVPRKGILRLDEALRKIADRNIKAIYIGSGSIDPQYEYSIFKGWVPHDKLPEYLSAADVFVLPTDNEGCSNAIIEALACGLPIISSDEPFNYDILNEKNSILIDSQNIDSIAEAIIKLKDDSLLRNRLSEGAIATARGMSITSRAQRIVSFMQEKLAE